MTLEIIQDFAAWEEEFSCRLAHASDVEVDQMLPEFAILIAEWETIQSDNISARVN